jgi:amylovoran biosynthesis glycosyltransferase AmsD
MTKSLAPAPEKRRVAVLINDMNSAGGIQRVAANLVRDLQPWYRTTLLTVEPLRTAVFHEPGLDFRSLNVTRKSYTRVTLLRDLFVAGRKLRRFVKEQQIDTVLAIWYDWASVAAIALPTTVKKIGCEHMSYWQPTRTWQLIRSGSYRYLDAVVSLTAEDLPLFKNISRSASVIPNYVPSIEPSPVDSREKIILCVGHLEARKGMDRLLWGLKQALIDHPDWKLVVVGGGEKGHTDWGYLDYLSVLIQLLQLEGRVEFHPATSRINEWYRRASIYALGSRREGLPMVLIEAKAHGLPIVSFDCPTGPKEIVRNGIDGYLIENDSIEFGQAASELMDDPELRRRMGIAAMEDVQHRFSPESVLLKWRQLIEVLHNPDR